MSSYAVVIEEAEGNLSGYVVELPGCVSVGTTEEDLLLNMQEAIDLYLEALGEDGESSRAPNVRVRTLDVA